MTNNERKLRRQHQDDRDIIASLNRIADQRRVRIDELLIALELAQQDMPGHRPDVTNVLLALIGWAAPWWWREKT